MKKLIGLVALLGCLTLARSQTPEQFAVRVHVIEGKTGKPIPEARIEVTSPSSFNSAEVWLHTSRADREGVGTIYIPWPPPDYVYIDTGSTWGELNACTPNRMCTKTILREGVAGQNLCWSYWHGNEPQPAEPKARPNNVYIYAHHNGGLGLALHHLFDVPTGVPWSKQPARKDCPPVTAADLAAATRPRPPRLNAKPKPSASPAKPAPPRSRSRHPGGVQ